jgi:hypothetical protein
MQQKWIVLLAIWAILVEIPGCGSNQRLVSITVSPTGGVVFGAVDPALFVQLTATGVYEHPPATKNITNQVTWTSDTPQVAVVDSAGKVTPSVACGVANVTASLTTNSPTGNVITGTVNVTVDGTPAPPCPSAAP